MNFRCVSCGKNLSVSYDADPVHGDMMMRPWYPEEVTGLNHQAVLCLKCSSVHDTSGAMLRFIFQSFLDRPLKVHCVWRPVLSGNKLEVTYPNGHLELIGDAKKANSIINSFPIDILNILINKNILSEDFLTF